MTTYAEGIVAALHRDLKKRFNKTGSIWDYKCESNQIKHIEQYVSNDSFNHFVYNQLHKILPTLTASEKSNSELGLEIMMTITKDWENNN